MYRSKTLCAKCFVPTCKNTTTNSRNKVFVLVRETVKKKWCQEVNIKYQPGQRLLCCQDHLNLEEDLENYQYWKLMKGRPILKSTAKLRIKKDLPSCSENKPAPTDESSVLKSLLLLPVENLPIKLHTTKSEGQTEHAENSSINNIKPTVTSPSTYPVKSDAAIQCRVKMIDQSTSTKDLIHTKFLPLLASSTSTSSTCGITSSLSLCGCTSDTESTATITSDQSDHSARNQMLQFISNDPKTYIGLPKQYFWLINYIVTQNVTEITKLGIIMTLLKIKLNDPVNRICDQFQTTRGTFSQSMHSAIQVLANYFQNLIFMPSLLQIEQNLPLPFKIRYSHVMLLLDTFEIEIQKPHNPMHQAQTWSQRRNVNTIKYLIGSTPNGFVSYVSKGYGGRISDKALVEKSGIINCLPDNAVIMADRGFKEVEGLLMAKDIKLLRPPRLLVSNKPTKEVVIQNKVVASLRVHIERAIRGIREFRFLNPDSVVSHKHVGYLDRIVLIACGLINLQSKIIKIE